MTYKYQYAPNNEHQKSFVEYDNLGRQYKVYQPIASPTEGVTAIPSGSDVAQTAFETSPLSRPIQQTMEDGKKVTIRYGINAANEVKKFVGSSSLTNTPPVVTYSNTYAANTLTMTSTWDENGSQSITQSTDPYTIKKGRTDIFKDKLGRVVLTRKYINTSFDEVNTYNVYDSFGNLVMVIPPGAESGGVITTALTFQYAYDTEQRMIGKKVPNADWQYFFYNTRDLLALTQDGNMRAAGKYLATVYDDLGRVVKTGFVTSNNPNNITISDAVNDPNRMSSTIYYNNSSWVKHQESKVLHHSDYTPIRNHVWSYIERRTGYTYTGNPIWTGKQHILLGGQPERPILDADAYGVDWSISGYNGLGSPTLTLRYLFTGTAHTEVRTYETYTYDNGQRLTNGKHMFALNGVGVSVPTFTLSNLNYNYKDQLTLKNIANVNSKYLQSVDYTYNGRGWLTNIGSVNETGNDYPIFNASTDATAINSPNYPATFPLPAAILGDDNPDLFTETIAYDAPNTYIPGGATAQYNGNISQVTWQIAGREKQAYSFKYDNLERLTEANYIDIHNSTYASHGWSSLYQSDNKYQEKVSYDLRGNIQSVQRNGLTGTLFSSRISGYFGQIDNLTYTYDPTDKNKLLKVADASSLTLGFASVNNTAAIHYTYDANGNLRSDVNKGIDSIRYNYLNLPTDIFFTGNRKIQFVYDASGAKLQKITTPNGGTAIVQNYVNGIEYNGNTLERIPHTEGEIVKDASGNYIYQYALKDHLGNRRVTFVGNTTALGTVAASDIKQVNHYYPFGMNMEGPAYSFSGVNKYQYNEKELNTDFGLNWNDYGARFYDASRLQFTSIDPLADAYSFQSPFAYAANNPIKYRDFMGMGPEGADGLSNEQWMNANRAADGGQNGRMDASRQSNQKQETEDKREIGKMESDIASAFSSDWEATQVRDSEGNVLSDNCDCGCPTKPPCKGVTYHYKRKTNNLDPSSLYKNILGTSYPGPFNPYRYNGLPDYSYSPGYMKFSEYPAIGHDRSYDLLQVKGGGGLFLETKAISADWRFVKQEFSYGLRLWSSPYGSKVDQTKALTFGTLLGLAALPKTIYSFSNPTLTSEVFMWNWIFKAKVNNIPSK